MLTKKDFINYFQNKAPVKKWRNISIILFVLLIFALLPKQEVKNTSSKNSILNVQSDCIAEVTIKGMILNDTYREKVLGAIRDEPMVKALLINVDSPGGTVVDSEILYDTIKSISAIKPTVVLMGNSAASGGYMLSLGANHIIARNGTITGSIGVLAQTFEVTDLAKKVGVNFNIYKSSELKGSPMPMEKTTEKIDMAMQSTINDIYEFFVNLVKENRKLTQDELNMVSNGQAFTGRQALKLKLIDEIGSRETALNYFKEKGIDLKVVEVSLKEKYPMSILEKMVGNVKNNVNFDTLINSKLMLLLN